MESYRTNLNYLIMSASRMRDNVERWLIHEGMSFEGVKTTENSFQVLVKHAGQYGIPVEIFEPKSQPGILVTGAKVVMKNSQISRYLGFNEEEKEKFEQKVTDFCNAIQVISKIITEDGKQKVGVYVVLDDKENINQMHEKTARFLLKTF